MREGFFRRREGAGECVGGEQAFKFAEDEAGVAVDVAADGEDGDTAVFDTERGGGLVSLLSRQREVENWFPPAWTGLLPESVDVFAREHVRNETLRVRDAAQGQIPYDLGHW